jgi:predicted negative regulator of RcsB-dependent stress response
MMRKLLYVLILVLVVLFGYRSFFNNNDKTILKENSALIQEQIRNVSKLVVTEGHFSQVFTYKNSKAIFANLVNVEKKALVVVNADVTVSYDLSQIQYELDEENKTLKIISIPKEEINISPDFEYYDVTADFLNPFEAEDYNKIKDKVKGQLMKKIEASNLKSNAQNRLISELSKFYILTSSLGWTLQYEGNSIQTSDDLQNIKL